MSEVQIFDEELTSSRALRSPNNMDSDTMKESPRRLDIMKDEQMNPEAGKF